MTFIQTEFVWFLLLIFTAYWALKKRTWQNALLGIASAVFYGWVHPWFLFLLYGSAVLDYTVGRSMDRWPHRKKWLLSVSLAGNLGLLAYFKYFNFFVDNVIVALTSAGVETNLSTLEIFLPVGISFYTFQTMSYTIDVYRGELKARRNFLDYVVFVSFFPQLVAGPVERASNLLPQMEKPRHFSWVAVRSGFALGIWGAAKKVCVADQVAPYVDKIFIHNDPSGAMIWAATLGFAIQILADFSAYTDIARGCARMLGFELMENFKHPYLAKDPSDFWRRWHISFSTWIRDYLYIPLGGSRGGSGAVLRSTFGAMLLSGLWHGASWTFVIWGAYHAVLITGYRSVRKRIPVIGAAIKRGHPVAIGVMFFFTCAGWLIFRETHIERLAHFVTLNPLAGSHEQWVAAGVMLAVCLACSIPLLAALAIEKFVVPRVQHSPWYLPLETSAWAVCVAGILLFVRGAADDFIYFQF